MHARGNRNTPIKEGSGDVRDFPHATKWETSAPHQRASRQWHVKTCRNTTHQAPPPQKISTPHSCATYCGRRYSSPPATRSARYSGSNAAILAPGLPSQSPSGSTGRFCVHTAAVQRGIRTRFPFLRSVKEAQHPNVHVFIMNIRWYVRLCQSTINFCSKILYHYNK